MVLVASPNLCWMTMSNDLVLLEAGLRRIICIAMGMWRDSLRRIPPIGLFLVEIRGAGPCRRGVHRLHVCAGGVLFEGSEHGGLASARAMARRMPRQHCRKVYAVMRCSGVCPPYLTWAVGMEKVLYVDDGAALRKLRKRHAVKLAGTTEKQDGKFCQVC